MGDTVSTEQGGAGRDFGHTEPLAGPSSFAEVEGSSPDYERQLFVANLPTNIQKEELRYNLFDVYGLSDEGDIQIHRPRQPGRQIYAFVTYSNSSDAAMVLNSHNREPHYIRQGTRRLVVKQRRRPTVRHHHQLLAGPSANDTITLDSDQSEEEDYAQPPYIQPLSVSSQMHPTPPPRLKNPNSAHSYILAQLKMKEEALEAEYAAKFQEVQGNLARIDKELKAKKGKKESLQGELQSLMKKIGTLDVEMAGIAADRDIAEKNFIRFGQEHDGKVLELKEEMKQFRDSGGRGSGADGGIDAHPVGSLLNDELECPCCFNQMTTEVYQCKEGHLICGGCHGRLQSCPVCRARYPQGGIRNRLAEKLTQANVANRPN